MRWEKQTPLLWTLEPHSGWPTSVRPEWRNSGSPRFGWSPEASPFPQSSLHVGLHHSSNPKPKAAQSVLGMRRRWKGADHGLPNEELSLPVFLFLSLALHVCVSTSALSTCSLTLLPPPSSLLFQTWIPVNECKVHFPLCFASVESVSTNTSDCYWFKCMSLKDSP